MIMLQNISSPVDSSLLPPSSQCPVKSNWFLPYNSFAVLNSYKWTHPHSLLLYLTWHYIQEIYPCGRICQKFLLCHCRVVFLGVAIPQLIYPFYCWWTFGSLLVWDYFEKKKKPLWTPYCSRLLLYVSTISVGHIGKSGIAELHGMCIVSFHKYRQSLFWSRCMYRFTT